MSETEEIPVPRPPSPNGIVHRLGAIALFAGGGAGLVFNAAHPRAGFTSMAKVLRTIADSGTWTIVHVGLILTVLLVTAGIGVVRRTIAGEPARTIARWGWHMTLVGAAVVSVGLAIDGPSLKRVADAWAASKGVTRAVKLATAEAVFRVEQGITGIGFMIFLGLGIGVLGYAIVAGRRYRPWTGWTMVGGGAAVTLNQLVWTLHGGITPATLWSLSIASLATTAALLGIGLELWRESQALLDRDNGRGHETHIG